MGFFGLLLIAFILARDRFRHTGNDRKSLADRFRRMILAALQIVAAGTSFTCTPVRVWDGDGPLWCAEGPRIRLAGIAARETDGTCRPNQPCPNATAEQARNHLVGLVGRPVGTSREGHIMVRGAALTACRKAMALAAAPQPGASPEAASICPARWWRAITRCAGRAIGASIDAVEGGVNQMAIQIPIWIVCGPGAGVVASNHGGNLVLWFIIGFALGRRAHVQSR